VSTRLKKSLIGIGALAALALGGAGLAQAGGSSDTSGDDRGADKAEPGDSEGGATGSGAATAKAAALRATNGGRANSVERDSENGATWEVEVTKTDGSTVDVRLDENLKLVVAEADGG
jgi:uncharacterized membrane protein YkoI